MDIVTILLIVALVVGLLALLIGNMTDNGGLSTFGLICAILGGLALFMYKFIGFLQQF